MKKIISLIVISLFFAMALSFSTFAATYFRPSITSSSIRSDYRSNTSSPRLHILIAPGHEPTYGGAEYLDRRERNITLLIGKELETLIAQNRRIQVIHTRDEKGWSPVLSDYFNDKKQEIITWRDAHQAETARLKDSGLIKIDQDVEHNDAAPDAALHLYGITKWSNENDIDIIINLHLNDTPRKNVSIPGPYSGFAIYIPEHQYSNASSSFELANSIKNKLLTFLQVSNMPKEKGGVVEDQDLIALGAYNTSNAASILIEYGYIYEPFFTNQVSDEYFAKRVALLTYQGLQDYLDGK